MIRIFGRLGTDTRFQLRDHQKLRESLTAWNMPNVLPRQFTVATEGSSVGFVGRESMKIFVRGQAVYGTEMK